MPQNIAPTTIKSSRPSACPKAIAKRPGLRFPIGVKLSVSFVAVTLFAGLVAGAFIDRNVARMTRGAFEDRLGYQATMLGQMTANALFGDLDPSDTSLNAPVHSLGDAVRTRLAVVAKDGTVVADSEVDDTHGLASENGAAEIVAARTNGTGISERNGRMYVARAITRDGATLGFARASVPTSEVTAQVYEVRKRIVLGSCVAVVAAILLGLFFSSKLVKPIRALSGGARRVGAGQLDGTIVVNSNDEIGDLADSFNDMTTSLRNAITVLDQRNRDMRIVLDNVGQGLLTLDRSGVVSKERSAIVATWLGEVPDGATLHEVLAPFDGAFAENFSCSWDELVEEAMPLSLLLDQLPKHLIQSGRNLELGYTPIRDAGGKRFDKVLVVLSDVTARKAAEQAEAEQRESAAIFGRIARDRAGVVEFLADAQTQVEALTRTERPTLAEVKRRLHTLKGNSAIFCFSQLSALCHDIETRMADAGGDLSAEDQDLLGKTWAQTRLRVDAFVGTAKGGVTLDDAEYAALSRAVNDGTPRSELARVVRSLGMDRATDRLERLAESAKQVGERMAKPVDVEVTNRGVRLPGEAWAPFWASLAHVIRNAVDHGLEDASARIAANKPANGRLRFDALRENGHIVLTVEDDGRGVCWEKVSVRAKLAGLPATTREDLVNALFADGVSSKDEVTSLSGRGVGLSAVKAACEELGGRVEVDSRDGAGTTFRFRIPLPREDAPAISFRDSTPPRRAA